MPALEVKPVVKQQAPSGEQVRQPFPSRIMDGVRRMTGQPPAILLGVTGSRFMADPKQPPQQPPTEPKRMTKESLEKAAEKVKKLLEETGHASAAKKVDWVKKQVEPFVPSEEDQEKSEGE